MPTSDNNTALAEFRDELRMACEAYTNGRYAKLHAIFQYNADKIPEECIVSRDGTYVFFINTTILKALGAEEGLEFLLRMFPKDNHMGMYFKAALGEELDKALELKLRKKLCKLKLAELCLKTQDAIREVVAIEDDNILQHTLTELASTCQWCAREMGDSDGG